MVTIRQILLNLLLSVLPLVKGQTCNFACDVMSWGSWGSCASTCGGSTRIRYASSVCCQYNWDVNTCKSTCYSKLTGSEICGFNCENGVWVNATQSCQCNTGWAGSCCNLVSKNCNDSPCENFATCTTIENGNWYECSCTWLTTGTTCENVDVGIVIGILLGCLVLLALIILIIFLVCTKMKKKKSSIIKVASKSRVGDNISDVSRKPDGRDSALQDSPWPYSTCSKTPIPEREDSGVVISVPPVSHCSFRSETEEYLLLSERTFVSFISKND